MFARGVGVKKGEGVNIGADGVIDEADGVIDEDDADVEALEESKASVERDHEATSLSNSMPHSL